MVADLVVDAPLAEGAVAAAVAAQGGADLAAVARAAVVLNVRLTNELGLHARPAALLARRLSDVDASRGRQRADRAAAVRPARGLFVG